MYQRNQQQQQQPNRDNYNNNNDDNYDSSESDSDSDADMDDNQGDGENEDMPANNNPLPNNEEDERQPHNDILERIDYQLDNRENVANIPDDARPDAFDENSRGNYELPILGESSGCNLNLEIAPPTVNDESSRESMDMDYESDKPTLGNIVVERNPRMEQAKGRNDSDEEANFYENDEFCSYLRNGEGDELKGCKCRKCAIKNRSHVECNNCTGGDCCDVLGVCFKDMGEPRPQRSTENDDEEFNNRKELDGHNFGISKSIDDKIADYSDDNDMDMEERDTVEKQSTPLKCTCFEVKLDHVNGHSSKMCVDLPKGPCEKCSAKNLPSTSAVSPELVNKNQEPEQEQEKAVENANDENKSLNVNADAENVENVEALIQEPEGLNNRAHAVVRNRDPIADLDNVRPNKRVKLNNGSASSRIKTPRTIFHKALDAVSMSWDNQHLKNILASNTYSINSSNAVQTAGSSKPSQTVLTTLKANFNTAGQPLWHEPLAMCAARVDSLRSHGHTDAALRLSVSVVRTMKQVQKDAQMIWKRYQTVANIPCNDDIPKKGNNCCCDCSKSSRKTSNGNAIEASSSSSSSSNSRNSNGNQPNNSSNNSSSSSNSRKRSYDSTRNSNMGGYSSSSSSMSNRAGYKMYRFDYHSSYRYSMSNDGCKRCLEARERVGYQNSFNNSYNANRFNMNGNGMHPTYFRNSFAPMQGGNMFVDRFNSNHFGSNSFRYGNNYPSHMPNGGGNHGGGQCHSDNCSLMHHRAQQNHHMAPNDPSYGNGMFNHSRPHFSRDSMDHHGVNGGMHSNNMHGNFNNGNSANRCSHDLKLREMINAPMQPRPMRHESGSSQSSSGCRSCDSKKTDEPSTSGMAAGGSASSSSISSANQAGPSGSNSVPMNNNDNQMKNMPMNNGDLVHQQSCSQHNKNQCRANNYCCNMSNDRPKCCRNDMHQMK